MKFSPTATLAFALATGIAGAALAQNTAPTNPQPAAQNVQANWQPGQTNPNFTQPQAGATQMQPARNQTQPGAQPQPAAGQAQATGSEQVKQAQQQLQLAGLYNGPVDGIMDPDTRAALARFQQQNGLPRTQDIDNATMSRLMGSQNTGSGTSAAATPAPTLNSGQVPDSGQAPAAPPTGAGNSAGQSLHR
jgi:peptidoglycan hydrolase-like protein with peptidoglycan-binding domain